MNIIPKKRTIYKYTEKVERCMVGLNYYGLNVAATVVLHEWLWFRWYTIKRFMPELNPYYDGEYASKTRCKMHLSYCVLRCNDYIFNLKTGNKL